MKEFVSSSIVPRKFSSRASVMLQFVQVVVDVKVGWPFGMLLRFEGKLTDFYRDAATYFGASDKTVRNTFKELKRTIAVEEHRGKGFKLA